MLNERVKNRLLDSEAAKLTAKYHLSDDTAYDAVKSIVARYESEVRKQEKQLAVMSTPQ